MRTSAPASSKRRTQASRSLRAALWRAVCRGRSVLRAARRAGGAPSRRERSTACPDAGAGCAGAAHVLGALVPLLVLAKKQLDLFVAEGLGDLVERAARPVGRAGIEPARERRAHRG